MNATPTPPEAGTAPRRRLLQEVIVEFGRHLDLLADQLGASVAEADRDCVSVGQSFHELSAVKNSLEAMPCAEPARSVVQAACRQIGDSLHTAVVALQYHDRLAQRLGLVQAALGRLQTLLEGGEPHSYGGWLQALREVEQINRHEQQRLGPVSPTAGARDEAAHSVELF